MALSTWLLMLLTHPNEFRILLQYHIYHEQKRDITAKQEHPTSGWDRQSMRRCWEFLDMTSRSFSAVIKELEGDLARVVCLFYLVLRGLDTIEDDMTLSSAVKQPLLRNFHVHSRTPGWNFTESGPDETDRQLLVEYQVVVEELGYLSPTYRDAILGIAEKMGRGMADFVARTENEKQSEWLETIADYDLYCHYVAGLVGEGCSLLFSASGKEAPHLAGQLELSNSMGLLLQKTNITRDFAEDVDERRYFWPREIWAGARYGGGFERMEDMRAPPPGTVALPGVQDRSLWVMSAMVLDALRHATDALDYLRMLKNQSVFNFVAIPATMAIATLELCFMNPRVFAQNVKIRKAVAASLIMRSTNPREVALIFRDYARKIHARASPSDPNFIRLAVACGKIEQWCEHYYPSFVMISSASGGSGGLQQAINPDDARGQTFLADEKREAERVRHLRMEKLRADVAVGRRQPAKTDDGALREFLMYLGGGAVVLFGVIGAVVYLIVQISD
ncbi:Squalene synthase [Mycena venus]|uniref:Squalene synthase n=1 Tax=Mycena venus TaxID=2733690 RepID=A0A8H6YD46_9AGAR|nr:Squalene synthase [Mycena venus]